MILITRPFNEAKILAKELKLLRLPTIIESLTSFQYYKKRIIFHEKKFFIVSSLQAVHAIKINKKNYQRIIDQGKFLVVGTKVASELKLLGTRNIIKQFSSSVSLLKYLLRKKKSTEFKIEYLCGSIINDEFIIGLESEKIKYKKIILYKTIPSKKISDQCLKKLKNNKIDIILVYSSYSAQILLKLFKQHKLINAINNIYILCLSVRIAKNFKGQVPKKKLYWCSRPTQKSLISTLKIITKRS